MYRNELYVVPNSRMVMSYLPAKVGEVSDKVSLTSGAAGELLFEIGKMEK